MTTADVPRPADVARRKLLAGAAWTLPAVATMAASPLASASLTVRLAFDAPAYAGKACSTIDSASVIATIGGAPAARQRVEVVLTGGYTFTNGSTTWTGVTADNGRLALPAIAVPAYGGTATASASSGQGIGSATLTAPPVGSAYNYFPRYDSTFETKWAPLGSVATGYSSFLAPNRDLYLDNEILARNVTSVINQRFNAVEDRLSYTTSTTAYDYVALSDTTYERTGIPAGSIAIGYSTFLAPNGDLYVNGDVLARDVTSATHEVWRGYMPRISYTTATAGYYYIPGYGAPGFHGTLITEVPPGSVTVGCGTFLAPNRDLYHWDAVVDSDVTSASHAFVGIGYDSITYTTSSAAFTYSPYGNWTEQFDDVPPGAVAAGVSTFISPQRDLYFKDGFVASNVTAARHDFVNIQDDALTYTTGIPC